MAYHPLLLRLLTAVLCTPLLLCGCSEPVQPPGDASGGGKDVASGGMDNAAKANGGTDVADKTPPSKDSNGGGNAKTENTNGGEPTHDPGGASGDPHDIAEEEPPRTLEDFIALNGAMFEDWPKPDVAILISGEQSGYIEPCGCAGLQNQKGGLKRRHTLAKQLRERGWPLMTLDLGDQVRRFGPQAEIKFRKAIQSLDVIGYEAVGLGPHDLQLSDANLFLVTAELGRTPFVAANVKYALDAATVEPYRVVEAGGRKIGVVSILGKRFQDQVHNPGFSFSPAEEAIAKVLPEVKEKADFLVLLSHAPIDESNELAQKFGDFDIVATAGGADVPPATLENAPDTDIPLIEVGHKGMYVVVLGLYDDAETPIRYQSVPLDGRFPDSPEMDAIFVEYQKELQAATLKALVGNPKPHPTGDKFVGSQVCADCHTTAYAIWEKTPHAHATETIVHLDPPRHHDAECLSCHVTGWDPQPYTPYESGFWDLESTPHLTANGCENCHGPGSRHVAAENGEIDVTEAMLKDLRKQMRLPYKDARDNCLKCHDIDNSPDFHKEGAFREYWKAIEHQGKD